MIECTHIHAHLSHGENDIIAIALLHQVVKITFRQYAVYHFI